jgi:hypothetical protein
VVKDARRKGRQGKPGRAWWRNAHTGGYNRHEKEYCRKPARHLSVREPLGPSALPLHEFKLFQKRYKTKWFLQECGVRWNLCLRKSFRVAAHVDHLNAWMEFRQSPASALPAPRAQTLNPEGPLNMKAATRAYC